MLRRLLVLLLYASTAFADKPKLARELQNAQPGTSVDVIVQFNRTPTTRHHQKIASRGGSLRAELRSIRAGAYTIPAERIRELSNDPEVVHISLDHKLREMLDLTAAAVNASAAWQAGLNGTGIGVAVIDSGVSNHDDLKGQNVATRIVYSQSFVPGVDANDHYGHGEHVAGIIAGDGHDSTCAPCTRLLKEWPRMPTSLTLAFWIKTARAQTVK